MSDIAGAPTGAAPSSGSTPIISPDARASAAKGHEAPSYVAPSHYLRPRTGIPDRSSLNSRATQPMSQGDIEQHEALVRITRGLDEPIGYHQQEIMR